MALPAFPVLLAALVLAGCDALEPPIFTTHIPHAVSVAVIDSATGAPVVGSHGTIRAGTWSDTLLPGSARHPVNLSA